MLKKIIRVVITIPIAIVLIMLSIANRGEVTLALNPFKPTDLLLSVTAPFFVYIFVSLMLGMAIGSVVTWLSQGRHRKRARQEAAESHKWHVEADRQKAKADNLANKMINPV